MNMFKKQAEEKRRNMETLRAKATSGKSASAAPAGDIDAAGIAADLEAKNSKPKRRKKQAGKVEGGQGAPAATSKPAPATRRRGRPAGKGKKKAEYADQRTSLSFTPTELAKLDQFAHDHYARRKGAILLAIDLAERYEALVERGLDDDFE